MPDEPVLKDPAQFKLIGKAHLSREDSPAECSGVAVLGQDLWSAKQGRDALHVDWDPSGAFKQCSDEILADFRKLTDQPGTPVTDIGDTEQALAGAATVLDAEHTVPYLAHATMETMDCVITPNGPGKVRVINGVQFQSADQ